MSGVASGEQTPVTVVVTRVVRPGHEDEFMAWADDVDRAAADFDGYRAGVRLHDEQGVNHLIYQFDSSAHLRAWERSSQRRDLLRRGDRISDERRSTAGGRDAWFTVPGGTAAPRWKTFLTSWVAVYPTLLIISTALATVAPGLPRAAALAVSSATLTAVLTWIIQPRLTRTARRWLLRGTRATPVSRPQ